MAKKILALGLAAALVISSALSFPCIKTAYKRHKAYSLINAAASEFERFDKSIANAREISEVNSYLLTDEERKNQCAEILDSDRRIEGIRAGIDENRKAFAAGRYDDVRISLDSRFGMKKGRRQTLIGVMQKEEQELNNVVEFCEKKRDMRNEVWANELYLIARLKSPYKPEGKDTNERLSLLPEELLKQVPVQSEELEEKLKKFEPELHNSLGVGLLNHQALIEHILQYGRSENVKSRALDIIYSAEDTYKQVMPLNDQLLWYRPQKHDGKMPVISYQELLEKQRKAISFVKEGDSRLQRLRNYYNELHEQYYIYVSGHEKKPETFSHTEMRSVRRYDSDGEPYSTWEPYTYYTDGWRFYYITTKVTPSGQSTDRVYVGEKDEEYCSWNYKNDEQVGFVRAWKRLHDDSSAIISGRAEALKPAIEKE